MTPDQIKEDLARRRQQSAKPSENGAHQAPAPAQAASEPEPLPVERPTAKRSQRLFHAEQTIPRTGTKTDVQRAPPHSVEAEQGVLGSMIIEPKWAIPLVLQKIGVSHFYLPAHQTIFERAIELFSDEGTFDLLTLTQYLRDVGQLEAVGGAQKVTALFTFVPTAANIEYYLEIVREKFVLREIIAENTEFVRRAYDEREDVDKLLREQVERSERLSKSASGTSRLPGLRDLSLMLGDNRPVAPPELVKDVLHQGSKLIVGGTSKGRKTYSLLDLAVSVATGSQWWGFDCIKGPVCYINFEIQESFFCHRTEDICRVKQVKLEPNMLLGWNLRGHGEGIENMVEELLFVLRLRSFVLIIFDPIYKALGNRDENKAGDVASMLNELEKIAVRTGAAIAFGAHYSKGNQAAKESIDRIGGSGVFARDPDSILTMTAHAEEDAFTVDPILRNFPPVAPFVLKWKWPLFTRDHDLDPEELKQPRKANSGQFTARYSKHALFEELSALTGIRPGELFKRLAELEGISRAQFYRLAGQLRSDGHLIEKDGLWFRGSKHEKSSKTE